MVKILLSMYRILLRRGGRLPNIKPKGIFMRQFSQNGKYIGIMNSFRELEKLEGLYLEEIAKKSEELRIKNLELERKREKQEGFIKNLAFTPFTEKETAFYKGKIIELMDKAREKEYEVIKGKNKEEQGGISKKYEQKISEHEKNLEQIIINLQSEIGKKMVQNETMKYSINKKEKEEKKREDQKNQQKDWIEEEVKEELEATSFIAYYIILPMCLFVIFGVFAHAIGEMKAKRNQSKKAKTDHPEKQETKEEKEKNKKEEEKKREEEKKKKERESEKEWDTEITEIMANVGAGMVIGYFTIFAYHLLKP